MLARRRVALASFALAALSLLRAAYVYMSAVLVEDACYRGETVWCAELSRTLTDAAITAAAAIVFILVGLALAFVRRQLAARGASW